MGTVYRRGNTLWVGFKTSNGWVYRSTGLAVGDEKAAKRMLADLERALINKDSSGEMMTVAGYADQWCEARRKQGLLNARRDERMVRHRILPELGHLVLGEVRPLHIRDFIAHLRTQDLASRTIINTYTLVRRMFADALADELISSTPCALKRGDLPRKLDKVTGWRETALFTKNEAHALVTSPMIPMDRRMTYAVAILGGLRQGEIAALRWSSIVDREPLHAIQVRASFTQYNGFEKAPKTGRAREVPVHPLLAGMLRAWRESGWVQFWGRAPMSDDLVVPSRHGSNRASNLFFRGLSRDLTKLGFRHRRFHDMRRTFVSLTREDGANPAVLRVITHDQKGDVFDQYTSFTWVVKCEAVSALRLEPKHTEQQLIVRAVSDSAARTTIVPTAGGTAMESTETASHTSWRRRESNSSSRPSQQSQPIDFIGRRRAFESQKESQKSSSVVSLPTGTEERAAVVAELSAASNAFNKDGDVKQLAARLRVLLSQLRGVK